MEGTILYSRRRSVKDTRFVRKALRRLRDLGIILYEPSTGRFDGKRQRIEFSRVGLPEVSTSPGSESTPPTERALAVRPLKGSLAVKKGSEQEHVARETASPAIPNTALRGESEFISDDEPREARYPHPGGAEDA
jgi:hypothetical protein